jgi:hypothetical protein
MNVDSLPQSSYPSSPPKDRDSTLMGLHHVVIGAKFIGERCRFFSYLPTVQKKPTNIVDLFLVTYKHFEPFVVTI